MPPPLPPPIVVPQPPASNGARGKAQNGSQNGQPQGGRVTRPDRLDYGGMRLNLEEASVEIVRRSTSGAPIVPEAAPAIAVSAEPMLPEAATAMPESRAPKTMGRFLKALTGN